MSVAAANAGRGRQSPAAQHGRPDLCGTVGLAALTSATRPFCCTRRSSRSAACRRSRSVTMTTPNGGSGAAREPAVSYGALAELRPTWC